MASDIPISFLTKLARSSQICNPAAFWHGLQIHAEHGGGYWDSLFFAAPLAL
jgi:hypothetical protein